MSRAVVSGLAFAFTGMLLATAATVLKVKPFSSPATTDMVAFAAFSLANAFLYAGVVTLKTALSSEDGP